MTRRVVIVQTGVSNTASVVAALERRGAETTVTTDRETIRSAERLVLPGVGTLSAGMATLREAGIDTVIADRVRAGRPTAAFCLGLQLLCARSEESPGVDGLGVIDQTVTRFPAGVRTPQFGWNLVAPDDACTLLQPGYAYFANSFRLTAPPEGWSCAMTDHGGPLVAAIERGAVLACQFHPELSGAWGLSLLDRWLTCAPKEAAPC